MVVSQVYSMQSLEVAKAVSEAGVDHVGYMVSLEPKPFALGTELARQVSRAVRPNSKSVIIPLSHRPEEIVEIARRSEPDLVQVASDEGLIDEGTFAGLSKELSSLGFKVMKVIAVGGGSETEIAGRYAPLVDIVMLDSFGAPPSELLRGYIGGTGKTHDWSISAEIVKHVGKPVILGGGLSIFNVADAIAKVRPWGVDAATSLNLAGQRGKKDITKVKEFVRLAKQFRY